MVVGEAPGEVEVKMRAGFVGPSGDELWHMIYTYCHTTRHDVRVTNVFHWPLETQFNKVPQIELYMALRELHRDIEVTQPMVILALGAIATHCLLPDTASHDMETVNAIPHHLPGTDIIVVPSFHPAATFRDSSKLQYLINACKVTYACMTGRESVVDRIPIHTAETPLETHIQSNLVALDTETLNNGGTYIVGVSAIEGQAALIFPETEPVKSRLLQSHVSNPSTLTLLHNALFDLPTLASVGITPARWYDTMTIAFLLQYLPLSLKELSYRLLARIMREYEEVVGDYPDLSYVPDRESVFQYAGGDPNATLAIYNILCSLWYDRMQDVLELDMAIQPMVVEMMKRGFLIDREHLMTMDNDLAAENYVRLLNIQKIAKEYGFNMPVTSGKNKGMTFNPRSSKQLEELLYNKLKLGKGKKIKKTSTRHLSTSKKMTALIKEEHPIVALIDKYKETATLQTSFLKSLQKHIQPDGCIHTDLSMTRIPHSGRFAASKPNLLAIPVRSDNGRKIREAFIAHDGYTYVSADLSQIELRVLAHNSQDATMLRVYREDKDIHANTAMEAFNIHDPKLIDDYKHRLPSKTTNFLICNLGTAQALSRELITAGAGPEWTVERCQEFIDKWFRIYGSVKGYLEGVGRLAYSLGYVTDMFGRREYIPQIYSCNDRTREEGIRIACNQRIQSGAQGIIKTIMRNVWEKYGRLWVRYGLAYPVLQIHDDLIHEVRDNMVEEAVYKVKDAMEHSVPQLSVPVKVGIKTGKVWGTMEKV
jgi:DNA polymerase-1